MQGLTAASLHDKQCRFSASQRCCTIARLPLPVAEVPLVADGSGSGVWTVTSSGRKQRASRGHAVGKQRASRGQAEGKQSANDSLAR